MASRSSPGCFFPQAVHDGTVIGCIVCRSSERKGLQRGYIAMLAVDSAFRKQGIGA